MNAVAGESSNCDVCYTPTWAQWMNPAQLLCLLTATSIDKRMLSPLPKQTSILIISKKSSSKTGYMYMHETLDRYLEYSKYLLLPVIKPVYVYFHLYLMQSNFRQQHCSYMYM